MPPRSSKRCPVPAQRCTALAALILSSVLAWPVTTNAGAPPTTQGAEAPEPTDGQPETLATATAQPGEESGDEAGSAAQGQAGDQEPERTEPAEGTAEAEGSAAVPVAGPAPPAAAKEPSSVEAPAPADSESASTDAPFGEEDEPLISAIDLGALVGFGVRLDTPSALEADSRVGLRFGLGANVFFSDVVAVGLQVEHLDLGTESSGIGENGIVNVDRDLNSLWLGLRAYPFATDAVGAYVNLGVAASWQSLAAAGIGWEDGRPDRGRSFQCEGSDTISAALRAGLGVDFRVTDGLQLVTAAGFDSYRLSDELLDGCAPGAGNASVLTAEMALAYRFAPGL